MPSEKQVCSLSMEQWKSAMRHCFESGPDWPTGSQSIAATYRCKRRSVGMQRSGKNMANPEWMMYSTWTLGSLRRKHGNKEMCQVETKQPSFEPVSTTTGIK